VVSANIPPRHSMALSVNHNWEPPTDPCLEDHPTAYGRLGGVSRKYEQYRRNDYSAICIRLPGGLTGSVISLCSFDMSLTRKGTRTCNIYSRGKTNAGKAQVENTCTCQTDFLRVTPAEVAKSSELQCKQMTDEPDGRLAYSLCDYSCPRAAAGDTMRAV
jgi:hypothetical protein